jgi:uncharacterized protein
VEKHSHEQPEYAAESPGETVVADVPERSRYELRVHDRLIGVAAYRRGDDRILFTHTEVDDEFEGRGFGTQLVLQALDDVRRQGAKVVPLCPFVAFQIDAHPEYRDLLAPDHDR